MQSDHNYLHEKYVEPLRIEILKFLQAYSSIRKGSTEIFDLNVLSLDKDLFKILGTYVYKNYNTEDVFLTYIPVFEDKYRIDICHFKDTEYHDRVINFITGLKKAYDSDMSEEIFEYINNIEDTQQREICKEYYSKLRLNSIKMKNFIFSDKSDKEDINKFMINTEENKNFHKLIVDKISKSELYTKYISDLIKKIRDILVYGDRNIKIVF